MKKILVSLMLCLAFLTSSANAENKPDEEYIIQKGDTLWDISDTRLEDTFLWPKLWSVNPQIDNPDLIYPGSRIRIPSREELMRMQPVPPRKIPFVKKPKSIAPKSRHVYEVPELTKPKYIIDKDLYLSSGFISDEFPSIGEIILAPKDRKIVGKDDVVYLKFYGKYKAPVSESASGPAALIVPEEGSGKFFTIRDIKKVKHPVTGKTLGRQIRITGIIKIIGADNNIPKAEILNSFEDVIVGDGLMPYSEIEPPLVSDIGRKPDITGYIVESLMNNRLLGKGDIIFLDKGEKDGLQDADVFSIYDKLPTERIIGTMQIISHKPDTSAAVILNSSQEILLGAKWGNK